MRMNTSSRTKPVRLEKKTTLKERIMKRYRRMKPLIIFGFIIVVFIVFFAFLFLFTPPVESGQYYNHFGGIL